MTHTPTIIVEGKDDYAIYNRIVEAFMQGKKLRILQIYRVDGYDEGCNEIIRCIHDLTNGGYFSQDPENLRRILGVIDRDSRAYRPLFAQEIDWQQLVGKGLFVLRYYSIESYFAAPYLVKELIVRLTDLAKQDIDDKTVNFVEQAHINSIDELYYISLEALKKACNPTYTAEMGYDTNDNIKEHKQRTRLFNTIQPKTQDLDNFAHSQGVTRANIKQICKGKWYLYSYIYKACFHIGELAGMCQRSDPQIARCPSCADSAAPAQCQYKRKHINEDSLYDEMLHKPDSKELNDVISVLSQLQA